MTKLTQMVKITAEKWINAVKGTRGQITRIANKLQVSRQSVYVYMEKSPKAKEIYEAESERPFDVAEDILHEKLLEKDVGVAKTLLFGHKRGKERGYGHTQDINLTQDKPLKLQLEIIDGNKDEDITSNEGATEEQ